VGRILGSWCSDCSRRVDRTGRDAADEYRLAHGADAAMGLGDVLCHGLRAREDSTEQRHLLGRAIDGVADRRCVLRHTQRGDQRGQDGP
jgi:hypothetical protein